MFTFCIQRDTIRVEPRDFGKDPAVAIKEEIQRRYANKVLPEVGLVISLLDILDASEGAVLYGDGCYYYRTEFRLIVFRPFIGEAFLGKVSSQSEEGIKVTVGFFDDILIPPSLLPEDSAFDPMRRAYFFVPAPIDEATGRPDPNREIPTPDELRATDPELRLYIERRDWVRIRCEEEHWQDVSPTSGKAPPPVVTGPASGGAPGTTGGVAGTNETGAQGAPTAEAARAPYSLICSMGGDGMGVLEWWDDDEPEGGGDQGMA